MLQSVFSNLARKDYSGERTSPRPARILYRCRKRGRDREHRTARDFENSKRDISTLTSSSSVEFLPTTAVANGGPSEAPSGRYEMGAVGNRRRCQTWARTSAVARMRSNGALNRSTLILVRIGGYRSSGSCQSPRFSARTTLCTPIALSRLCCLKRAATVART